MLIVAKSEHDRRWLCRQHRVRKFNPNHDELGRFASGPGFASWFGNSKVVDASGRPQVVYHGTSDQFTSFDLNSPNRKDSGWLGSGVYLTSNPETASAYATLKPGAGDPNVMPLYASLQNPYYATQADKERLQFISHNEGMDAGRSASEKWTQELKAKGHDGVILEYPASMVGEKNAGREIVVFDPGKVKSVYNTGTFDPSTHDISKSSSQVITKAADTAEIQRLLSQQSYMAPQVRRAFLAAVNRIQSQIDVDQIALLLKMGRTQEAIAQVEQIVMRGGYQSVANAVTQAVVAAGTASGLVAGQQAGLDISFGLTNPQTLQFLRSYEMGLITNISQDSLASVRTAITAGVTAGQNPLTIARDVRQFIGLTARQTQAVINYRSYLDSRDSTALERVLRDARFDPTIQSAIDSQTELSSEYIDKVVQRYSDRMLAYRAQTISRTEAMRSVNAGNHQLWNQAVADGKVAEDQVTRQWVYTHDFRTRPWHRDIPANNPDGVGLNEPFQTDLGPLMYPGDPAGDPENTINCRCTCIYRVKPQSGSSSLPTTTGGLLSEIGSMLGI